VRPETGPKAGPEPDEPARRDEKFKKLVTNAKLSGHFTMDGQEDAAKLQKEVLQQNSWVESPRLSAAISPGARGLGAMPQASG
jgi:hypothetical protein